MNAREALKIFDIDGEMEIDVKLKAGEDPRVLEHRIKVMCKSRERAMHKKYHPDTGGSHELFLQYQEAIAYMQTKFRIKVVTQESRARHQGPTDRSSRFFDEDFINVQNVDMSEFIAEMMRNQNQPGWRGPGPSSSTNSTGSGNGFSFSWTYNGGPARDTRFEEKPTGPNGEIEDWVKVPENGRIDFSLSDLSPVEIFDTQIYITGIAYNANPILHPKGEAKGYIDCKIGGSFISTNGRDTLVVFTHEFPINIVKEDSQAIYKEFCSPSIIGSIDLTSGRARFSVERGQERCFVIERDGDGIQKSISETSRVSITHIRFEITKLDIRDNTKKTPVFRTVKR